MNAGLGMKSQVPRIFDFKMFHDGYHGFRGRIEFLSIRAFTIHLKREKREREREREEVIASFERVNLIFNLMIFKAQ